MLMGMELEKALERAEKMWTEDEDVTWTILRSRFSSVSKKVLKDHLRAKGLYPRKRTQMAMSYMDRKAKVPGPYWSMVGNMRKGF